MIDFEELLYYIYMDESEQNAAYKNRSSENEELLDGEEATQTEKAPQ